MVQVTILLTSLEETRRTAASRTGFVSGCCMAAGFSEITVPVVGIRSDRPGSRTLGSGRYLRRLRT